MRKYDKGELLKETKKSASYHWHNIKRQFKEDWKKWFWFRIGAMAVFITASISIVSLFIWLVVEHALFTVVVMWGTIVLVLIAAILKFIYGWIDKKVRNE